ncbi:MAG: formyltransferase family protein [Patescibacteria group bacterium]|jgi:methionyl-tRNA formyltransferase
MKVIFLGKNKPSVIKGLQYLIKKKINVIAIAGITDKNYPNISVLTDNQLYLKKFLDVDVIISYLYPKKIKKSFLSLSKIGCVNFHPAPLPNFRGVCGYSFGIFKDVKEWGVSAHFIDKDFDTGDIIKVKKFSINPDTETAFSLEKKAQLHLYELFKETINIILEKGVLPRIKQKKGYYYSMKEFEKLRKIKNTDSLETIDKKIRACWFPPYPGASISIKGKEFTLINDKILKEI